MSTCRDADGGLGAIDGAEVGDVLTKVVGFNFGPGEKLAAYNDAGSGPDGSGKCGAGQVRLLGGMMGDGFGRVPGKGPDHPNEHGVGSEEQNDQQSRTHFGYDAPQEAGVQLQNQAMS